MRPGATIFVQRDWHAIIPGDSLLGTDNSWGSLFVPLLDQRERPYLIYRDAILTL
jgi:hypothetical protein